MAKIERSYLKFPQSDKGRVLSLISYLFSKTISATFYASACS